VEKAKAAAITHLDGYVGQIIAALKRAKLGDETLIVFTSDNGPHEEGGVKANFFNSSGPLRGTKRDLYEGGIRVPMIAWWPGRIKAGHVSDHISAFWDVLPTFAEVAGIGSPKGIDGISFLPELLGKPQPPHEYLYWEFFEGSSKQAVRMGDWKAVRLGPSKPIELYHLKSDLREENNVAAAHPALVARVKNILMEARTNGDLWPLADTLEVMKH
jgi:arylsulfatase A-like enzyme